MKEFIFTWTIGNISYSWQKRFEAIVSPSFRADTIQNTLWTLNVFPKGDFNPEWLSLYLYRKVDNGPRDFLFDYEFSCVSANNLTLISYVSTQTKTPEVNRRVGQKEFLKISEVFDRKKALYLPQDTLTLRCRMWKHEGDDKFGQSSASTYLEIERILLVEDVNPISNKTISLHSKKQNKLLISVDVSIEKDCLKIEINPVNIEKIMFSTFQFSAVGKTRKSYKFVSSWADKPCKTEWKKRFSNTKKRTSIGNKLKLTCEFTYSTGEQTNSIENVNPCLFKFPEFSSDIILSCISSGQLFDCPNIYKDLWDLYTERILCDVELKTPTASFWVHKVILCARSPVFSAMLANDMKEKMTNCVEIEDLEDETLEKLVKFLYTDSLEVTLWDSALELYYSADKYQVPRLKTLCYSFFMSKVDVLTACELLELADRHNDSDLQRNVEDYLVNHRETTFRSTTWKQFSEKQPLMAARAMICEYEKGREEESFIKTQSLFKYPKAIDDFGSLYKNLTISDIAIQTSTATFPAHKAILYAGSSTIRKILASEESPDTLKVEDLEDGIVAHLLLFLYTDCLGDVKWEDVTKLYHAAVVYQIERLKIACVGFFLTELDLSTARDLLQVAQKFQNVKLKSQVEEFISLCDQDIRDFKVVEKGRKINPPNRTELRRSKRLKLEK